MARSTTTSLLVDELIRYITVGTLAATVILAPGAIRALDKPLRQLDEKLTKREREREARRIVRYMRQKGYLAGDYEHGLRLTKKAKRRLEKIEIESVSILSTKSWDKRWRIIVYDIPEAKRNSRRAFSTTLRRIGCIQLQKSTWITPFECRTEITTITSRFDIEKFVSYFEAINLENEKAMVRRFKDKYPHTRF